MFHSREVALAHLMLSSHVQRNAWCVQLDFHDVTADKSVF